MKELDGKLGKIQCREWNGQNSLHLSIDDQHLWIDPFNLPDRKYDFVDIIFITHEHFDHLDEHDLAKVADPHKTKVYAPTSCIQAVKDIFSGDVLPFDVGDSVNIGSVKCRAFPAYGIIQAWLHPKEKGWISLLFDDGKVRTFIASDTERVPEFKEIEADVVFLSLGQKLTFLSLQEVVDVIMDVKAKIAVPVHYGMNEGDVEDVEKLKTMLKSTQVQVISVPFCGREEKISQELMRAKIARPPQ
ncbi:MAG: MBL fold metallo-hydrolase [Spirochaetia bacterium]